RLPAVQNYVTQKAISYVSAKTQTRIELNRLYIAFPKSIVVEGLYVEDIQKDTLLYLQKISIDINMLALLKNRIEINEVVLSNSTANIHRNTDSVFNFNFLIEAFASDKPDRPKEKTDTDTAGWQIAVH